MATEPSLDAAQHTGLAIGSAVGAKWALLTEDAPVEPVQERRRVFEDQIVRLPSPACAGDTGSPLFVSANDRLAHRSALQPWHVARIAPTTSPIHRLRQRSAVGGRQLVTRRLPTPRQMPTTWRRTGQRGSDLGCDPAHYWSRGGWRTTGPMQKVCPNVSKLAGMPCRLQPCRRDMPDNHGPCLK